MSALSFLNPWIEYLKDPLLVAKFQRRFGVVLDPLDKLRKVDCNGWYMESELSEYKEECSNDETKLEDSTEESIRKRREIGNRKSIDALCEDLKNEVNGSVRGSADNEKHSQEQENSVLEKVVGNKIWYYIFLFGTALGDEVFYASFFSFWFWNIDGAVGRRVVLVWALVMYIGQGLKDVICWPRPASPPVIRLEKKWELEYGMPSTHAMTGAAVPFSILIFTSCRYEYPFALGVCLAMTWCTLVCCSRIYLGMHSVLDIVAGLALVSVLFLWVIPVVDWLDPILLTHEFGALYLLIGAIILAICSPGGDRWTPARGDTIVILGSAVGLISGAWMNYQLGIINSNGPPIDPPFPIIWPSYKMLGLSFLRLCIGLAIVLATRATMKSVSYATFKGLMQSKTISYIANPSVREIFVELAYKFITYLVVGFNIVFLAPTLFRFMGIERPTFHTEV